MVSGLARSLRSESAALDLITIDFDTTSNTIEQMKETTMMLANRQIDVESVVDAENLVENGMIYVSRLAPIVGTNNACGPFLHHAKASVLEKNASLEAMVQSGKLRLQYRDDKLQSPEDSQAEVMISSLGTNEAVSLNAPTICLESNQNTGCL